MSVQAHNCRPERIAGFLNRSMSDSELAALEDHLAVCSACQKLLGDQTAAAELWDRASRYLRDDRDEPDLLSEASDLSLVHHGSHAIQAVLDSLRPTDDPEMLGRLGSLEVGGVVGAGAMGIVLKAFDHSLDRTVAVKVLAPHLASSSAARRRFAREAKAAAAVLHPNVMAIHSVSNDQSLPYLVMPYYRGVSLQKRLDQEGPPPLAEILRIGMQIAAGLAAAHAQGLIHRDIKPANILLEEGVERVAITDFGLARAVDDAAMTRTGVIAGTPQYMSPEQARGESLDQRSDLFSLGSVLYAMCTGRPPFRAETSYGVLRRITDEEPRPIREINAEIPVWLCRIIAKLLAKRPDDRFTSASEVAVLLEAYLAHVQQPTAVALPEPIRDAGSSPRAERRRWIARWLAAAAFALVMLLAGIVVVLELNKGTLTIESEVDDISVRITQGDTVVEKGLTVTRAGKKFRVAAGTYLVEIESEADGITVENETVTLERGGTKLVRIVRESHADHAAGQRQPPTVLSSVAHHTHRTDHTTPLEDAIAAVNKKAQQVAGPLSAESMSRFPGGSLLRKPSELSDDEVLAAIRNWQHGPDTKFASEIRRIFQGIAEKKVLPPGASLRGWSQWWDEGDEYEEYRWTIQLDLTLEAKNDYGLPIRNEALARRQALRPSPGYTWAVHPHRPGEHTPTRFPLSIQNENGALVVTAKWSARGDFHEVRLIVFDEHGKRYVIDEPSLGGDDDFVVKRFRLNREELPAAKVRLVGVEAMTAERLAHVCKLVMQRSRDKGIDVLPFPHVGRHYPFKLTTVDGRTIDSESLGGKVIVIDCWASWCAPSMKRMPELKKIHDQHSKGLEIVSVSFDNDPEDAKAALEHHDIAWPSVVVPAEPEFRQLWEEANRIRALPTLLLIDRNGVLRTVLSGRTKWNLDEEIAALVVGQAASDDGAALRKGGNAPAPSTAAAPDGPEHKDPAR